MHLDLQNQTLTIGFNNDLPYSSIDPNRTIGIEPVMIRTMAKYFNFSVEFIDCQGVYGSKQPNGTWTGLIGMLSRNEIDLGIGGVIMTHERMMILQYLYPHMIDTLSFATTKPQNNISFDILWKPFDLDVWLCLFATLIMFTIFNQFETYITNLKNRNRKQDKNFSHHHHHHHHHYYYCYVPQQIPSKKQIISEFHRGSLVWISLCLLFREPYPFLRSLNKPMKICISVWILSTMIMTNAYNGYMCSLLTIPSQSAIDTVFKLAQACRSKRIVALSLGNSSIYDFFQKSQMETFQDIQSNMLPVSNNEQAVQMLVTSTSQQHRPQQHRLMHQPEPLEYAVLTSRDSLEYFELAYGKGTIYLPPEKGESSFYPILISLPARPTFEFSQPFNRLITRFTSNGLINYWFDEEMLKVKNTKKSLKQSQYDQEQDEDDDVDKIQKFSLEHLASIFYLYLICSLTSLIAFLMEIFSFINPCKSLFL